MHKWDHLLRHKLTRANHKHTFVSSSRVFLPCLPLMSRHTPLARWQQLRWHIPPGKKKKIQGFSCADIFFCFFCDSVSKVGNCLCLSLVLLLLCQFEGVNVYVGDGSALKTRCRVPRMPKPECSSSKIPVPVVIDVTSCTSHFLSILTYTTSSFSPVLVYLSLKHFPVHHTAGSGLNVGSILQGIGP